MKASPFISIVIRTKDRPHLLKQALESVAQQEELALEAVVVNDGGREVSEVVEAFKEKISLKYISLKRSKGRAAAANVGLKAASGEWVGLLDDDDIFLPKALKKLFANELEVAEVVYGKVELLGCDAQGRLEKIAEFGFPFSRERLFLENYIPTCGLFFKKRLALEIGGFDRRFRVLEDWDFIFRLALKTDFLFIPQFVAQYRTFNRSFILGKVSDEEALFREKFYKKHWKVLSPAFLKRAFLEFQTENDRHVYELQLKINHLNNLLQAAKSEKGHLEELVSQLQAEIEKLKQALGEQRAYFEGLLSQQQREKEYLQKENAFLQDFLKKIEEERRDIILKLEDKKQLCEAFKVKAEVFRARTQELRRFLRRSYARERELKEALEKEISLRKEREELIKAIVNSFSWRLTEPLRRFKVWLSGKKGEEKERSSFKIESLKYQPLISVIVPVYNPPKEFLVRCLESVFAQTYPHWELCIADDASSKPYVKEVLEAFRARDKERVKVVYRQTNGHICVASNDALSLAKGEFVALVDHDDELDKNALLEVVKLLNEHPQADMIYTDEDKIAPNGRYIEPYFKPDWAPEFFLGQMYTCHLGVYRRKLVEEIGGFRKGFEGAQDYDLVLRLTEKTSHIYHIPKVLYHWRMHGESTAQSQAAKDYAFEAGFRAVKEALARRKEGGYAEMVMPGRHLVHYPLKGKPFISIIIPSKDLPEVVDKCLRSIFDKTQYVNFEVLIVDNGSQQEKTWQLYEKWQREFKGRFRVEPYDIPFNFSKLVNYGVGQAKGELILLLNNDTELIGPTNWLEEMGGYAQREEIGCVGAVLLYPDNTIQHAGVILGIRGDPKCPGVAGHAFKYLPAEHPGYFDRLKVVSNYAAVTGACLMVRRSLWEKVNGFDETLAVAFNDIDFCLRLLKAGYRHVVLPQVRLYHYESKSRGYEDTKEKQMRFRKEIEIMRARWAEILDNDPYYNPNLPLTREDFGLGK